MEERSGGPNVSSFSDTWGSLNGVISSEPVESDETTLQTSLTSSTALTINPEERSEEEREKKNNAIRMNIKAEEHEDIEPKKNNIGESSQGVEHSYDDDPDPQVSSFREASPPASPRSLSSNESRTANCSSLPSLSTLSSLNLDSSGGMQMPPGQLSMSTIKDSNIDEEKSEELKKPSDSQIVLGIPLDIIQDVLGLHLDNDEVIIKCWKNIASRHGVSHKRISWMGGMSRTPTWDMLRLPEFTGYTISDLKKDLSEIQRFDCLYELKGYYPG